MHIYTPTESIIFAEDHVMIANGLAFCLFFLEWFNYALFGKAQSKDSRTLVAEATEGLRVLGCKFRGAAENPTSMLASWTQ